MNAQPRPAPAVLAMPLLLSLALSACVRPEKHALEPLPQTAAGLAAGNGVAAARVNGQVGSTASVPPAQIVAGAVTPPRPSAAPAGPGSYSLDFADAEIRDVVAQILGGMLGVNYAVDPAVHGTVTLRTTQPLTRGDLLPTLQSLLAGNGATLVSSGGIMRVVPTATAGSAGSRVVPLRFVSAEELAKVLQPLAGTNAKVGAETALNALVLSGDPAQLDTLEELVHSFDVDALAGQSYALLPVATGSAHDFSDALQEAFQGRSGGSLAGLVRVAPLPRLGAVLVVAAQPRYIDAARKVYAMVEQQRRSTIRSWRVYYLQNSNAQDIAYTLQTAFTPNSVSATPKSQQVSGRTAALGQAGGTGSLGGGGVGSGGMTGTSGGLAGAASSSGFGAGGGIAQTAAAGSTTAAGGTRLGAATAGQATASANPLLGGLEPGSSGADTADSMRVLPDDQNNALLIYGTAPEADTVEAMLRKLDILPLQVRIDATIAEVDLTDKLQYGTQFFFKSGGINSILNNASGAVTNPASTVLGTSFPGFLVGGTGQGGAPFAISALQAVTTVNVLSSPQLVVVDNETARLQVGSLVPYLTASAQSTLTSNAQIVNSVGYQPTGVIMDVTPRVNGGGLVTLDIRQEVSDVDTSSASTTSINSPTFNQQIVSSRVVVQDGQTIGIAGLIRDNASRGNQGIPWLKDIPVLGLLAGTQNNQRTRTELLVLITPHVMRDQRQARQLTEDLRETLGGAAAVPHGLSVLRPSGSSDPSARLRHAPPP
jgi:general secretion pathway protein D